MPMPNVERAGRASGPALYLLRLLVSGKGRGRQARFSVLDPQRGLGAASAEAAGRTQKVALPIRPSTRPWTWTG